MLLTKVWYRLYIVGAAGFILLQQLVIVDMAANWNESWVEKSNQAESDDISNRWLGAILVAAGSLFAFSLGMIVWMFVAFTGCASNNTFIALTLIFNILVTAAQLSGEEGSLLSSACVAAWASVLCYSAVAKNPNDACNPGESTALSIAFGVIVTIISLLWTSYSYTAGDMLSNRAMDEEDGAVAASSTAQETEGRNVGGVVTGVEEPMPEDSAAAETEAVDDRHSSNTWRLNVALAVICCWSAMVLTHWGEIQVDGFTANPTVGSASMWVIIGSQWIMLALYIWTLVAPRLFPDRDFS